MRLGPGRVVVGMTGYSLEHHLKKRVRREPPLKFAELRLNALDDAFGDAAVPDRQPDPHHIPPFVLLRFMLTHRAGECDDAD